MRFTKHSKTAYSCPIDGVRLKKVREGRSVVACVCPVCGRGFRLPRPISTLDRKQLFGRRKKGGKLGH